MRLFQRQRIVGQGEILLVAPVHLGLERKPAQGRRQMMGGKRVERPGRRLDEFQPLHRHVVAERIRRDDIRVRDLGVDQRAGQAEVPALARLEGDLRLYAVTPRLAAVGIVVRYEKSTDEGRGGKECASTCRSRWSP